MLLLTYAQTCAAQSPNQLIAEIASYLDSYSQSNNTNSSGVWDFERLLRVDFIAEYVRQTRPPIYYYGAQLLLRCWNRGEDKHPAPLLGGAHGHTGNETNATFFEVKTWVVYSSESGVIKWIYPPPAGLSDERYRQVSERIVSTVPDTP
jgi:hypothetical protein